MEDGRWKMEDNKGLFEVFLGNFLSSPKAFIGDPVLLKKSLDSRLETLRE